MIDVGDIMSTVGVIMSTVGDIMMHVVEYHDYRGGVQYRWGDIMTTVGVLSTMEGYHDACARSEFFFGGGQGRRTSHVTPSPPPL